MTTLLGLLLDFHGDWEIQSAALLTLHLMPVHPDCKRRGKQGNTWKGTTEPAIPYYVCEMKKMFATPGWVKYFSVPSTEDSLMKFLNLCDWTPIKLVCGCANDQVHLMKALTSFRWLLACYSFHAFLCCWPLPLLGTQPGKRGLPCPRRYCAPPPPPPGWGTSLGPEDHHARLDERHLTLLACLIQW